MDHSKVGVIVDRLRASIRDGSLTLGDPLPSTRRLAADLGVARGTVVAAYEQLDGEGYIRTRQGTAARVAAELAPTSRSAAGEEGGPEGTHDTASATIDLRPGIPDVGAMSDRDRRAAWRAALSLPAAGDPAPLGAADLREQVAVQLALTRGFSPRPERVIVTGGTSDAVSLLIEALGRLHGRHPRVVVEDPGYPSARAAAASAGGELLPLPLDDRGLDPDLIPDGVDAVLVTPAHQYPFGAVMPVERRARLLARAAELDAVVVEDDYDGEFRHRGDPVPALASLDDDGVVIHLGTFSKNLDPALRCGYAVTPRTGAVADAVRWAREARGPVVADVVQAAITHLLRSGALRRHVGRRRRDYTHKRSRIIARLPELAAHGVTARALDGGLHAVLTWGPEPGSGRVVRLLQERGVRVADLARYRVRPDETEQGIVLGYGSATLTQLEAGLDALVAVVSAGGTGST